tara:strand:+ start:400 stop:645 length:246 start_codon:yes stop_codon:yes gene_type:complete
MMQGEAKANLDKAMEAVIQEEVERRMKDLPVHITIDGELVDVDACDIIHDEIYVEIKTPIFFNETGKTGFITQEEPAKLAG